MDWLLKFFGENCIEFKNEILVLTKFNYFYNYPGKGFYARIKTRINVSFNVYNTINNVRFTLLHSVQQSTLEFLLIIFFFFLLLIFQIIGFECKQYKSKIFLCTVVRNTFKKYIFERSDVITILNVTVS